MSVHSYAGLSPVQIGALSHPGYVAGLWYGEQPIGGQTGEAVVADTLIAMPWRVYDRMSVDQLAVNISTGASGLCGLAIYGPDDALLGATAMTMNTTSIAELNQALTATAILPGPGVYWLAYLGNAAPSVTCYTRNATTMQTAAALLGSPTSAGLYTSAAASRNSRRSVSRSFASGFPASLSAATRSSSVAPIIAARAA